MAWQRVAAILEQGVRMSDSVFRYGGEEFTCLFPVTGPAGSAAAAERLRIAVQEAAIEHPGNPPANVVTISVGYANYDPDARVEKDELFRQADAALYRAKQQGRNRTKCA